MDILLLAAETMISQTLHRMLESNGRWNVFRASTPKFTQIHGRFTPAHFDGIVVNLPDFTDFYIVIIHKIRRRFPDSPLLAISNYADDLLINPLLAAGADGYLQLGQSDTNLRNAVKTIINGDQCVITENT